MTSNSVRLYAVQLFGLQNFYAKVDDIATFKDNSHFAYFISLSVVIFFC